MVIVKKLTLFFVDESIQRLWMTEKKGRDFSSQVWVHSKQISGLIYDEREHPNHSFPTRSLFCSVLIRSTSLVSCNCHFVRTKLSFVSRLPETWVYGKRSRSNIRGF